MDMSSIQATLPAQQPAVDYYSSAAFRSEYYTQNPTSTYGSHMPQGTYTLKIHKLMYVNKNRGKVKCNELISHLLGDIQQMTDQVPNPQIP